jgi:hypothetical protein
MQPARKNHKHLPDSETHWQSCCPALAFAVLGILGENWYYVLKVEWVTWDFIFKDFFPYKASLCFYARDGFV